MEINCTIKVVYEVITSIKYENECSGTTFYANKCAKIFDTEEEAREYKKILEQLTFINKVRIKRRWQTIKVFDQIINGDLAYEKLNALIDYD